MCALSFTPVLAWELFSIFYYGFPLPNTYYAKVQTGIAAHEYWKQGFKYLINFVGQDPGGFLVYAVGLALGLWFRGKPVFWVALGIVLHTIYTVSVGGDFMTGRFFSASVVGGAIIILASPLVRSIRATGAVVAGLLLVGLSNPDSPVFSGADYKKYGWNDVGIADERGWYFSRHGLIALGRATPSQGSQTGPRRVEVTNNIGFAGYRGGPGLVIIDALGLSDPLIARIPARFDSLWRIGHFQREIPAGYFESVKEQKNLITDRPLGSFYDKLSLITRGPLFSVERLKTIFAMNLGQYESLIDTQRYRYGAEVLPQAQFSVRRAEHTDWNASGVYALKPQGLRVVLHAPIKAVSIDIGVDCNDSHDLVFLNQREEVGSVVADASKSCPGIVNQTYRVPPYAADYGFDTLYVRPRTGDGLYALSHVIPNPR